MEVNNLEPQGLWQNFVHLNAVPRASKKEDRVIAFMMNFGEELGLETIKDAVGNVVIKKNATPGMDDRKTVVLQSHLDMVHQKNSDTAFDFDEQGIDMFVEGDWVKARGTTLGADNGIGVAAIMALLASDTVEHPTLEAMFTIDEETGMTGAKQLDPANFTGSILLNLDTEEDDELTIGCAGGIDTNTRYNYQQETTDVKSTAFEVKVKGLVGGHSGIDIHKGRANANKLMNRLLYVIAQTIHIQLHSVDGGSLRNAIPRESTAVVVVPYGQKELFILLLKQFSELLTEEYSTIEPSMIISSEETTLPSRVMTFVDFKKIVNAIYALPNGVFRMSPDISNLVEASTNLARVIVKDGEFITQSLQRSSVESTKADVSSAVSAAFENIGCNVQHGGDYPGWKPDPDSDILRLMTDLYRQIFGKDPKVEACHAGLECGILGAHLPGMDMISFGPTIRAAHSPDERVQISSVKKFWVYLTAILKEIPKDNK
ncbi:aminoacyl-histidine dipeptidase [Pedobacter hartonius]|uniref:Cytosol non-specific dipeptidase n=1 Tax=Pedobacter hartonius TaxID=425514 RepID=A0A1H4BFJ3_9SPHI|nr:aminoacyl-histidine dipeptidase [Pedobacter hartonius]SEA46939.1 dipeptidase D [Pedobacter hartonius]